MHTWLPYPNYALSVHCLPPNMIGKQRIEAMYTLMILRGGVGGMWKYHPNTVMWRGYEYQLCQYTSCAIREWDRRYGTGDEMIAPDTRAGLKHWKLPEEWLRPSPPPVWLGYTRLHASHRAALKRREEWWFQWFDWDEPRINDVFWPSALPDPGGYIISPDQEPWLVIDVRKDYTTALRPGRKVPRRIPNRDIQTRVWQVAQRG